MTTAAVGRGYDSIICTYSLRVEYADGSCKFKSEAFAANDGLNSCSSLLCRCYTISGRLTRTKFPGSRSHGSFELEMTENSTESVPVRFV